jgi:hypothetical protein
LVEPQTGDRERFTKAKIEEMKEPNTGREERTPFVMALKVLIGP